MEYYSFTNIDLCTCSRTSKTYFSFRTATLCEFTVKVKAVAVGD
jgi:hypothetical protein